MKKEIKILITGSVGSGKTSIISNLSDVPVISSEANVSDDVILRKATTTVVMDFGEMHLANDQVVRVYGTPGQDRFSFMWPILSKGAMGLIILLDNSADNYCEDLRAYLNAFANLIAETTVVIGVTHVDKGNELALDKIHQVLADHQQLCPVFSIDARVPSQAKMLAMALLAMLQTKQR